MSLPLMKNYIDGAWIESESATVADITNPANGETIASVAYGTAEDVDRAVNAAAEAFASWRETPPLTRARYLFRLKEAFERTSRRSPKCSPPSTARPSTKPGEKCAA
jgi:malonate-semialdehyde dehydrogenase (acetylating)/methylmalonate-semialdehyde dehydrogenase